MKPSALAFASAVALSYPHFAHAQMLAPPPATVAMDPQQVTCIYWYVEYGGTSWAHIHAPSMTVIRSGALFSNAWNAPESPQQVLLTALVPATAATAIKNYKISCLVSGSDAMLAADFLRKTLDAEVQKTVKATVEKQMDEFLKQLQTSTEADRIAMINAAIQELPKNATLVDALRKAVEVKPKK